ncbi:MAG: alpha/beta hydrolase fold domain-containing protein [Acidimicrobiales bacterium]
MMRRGGVGLVLAVVVVATASMAAATQAVDVRRDLRYGTANGRPLLLDVYVPAQTAGGSRPAVVMIHGGGWRVGDKASWAPEATRLVERGWVAFSINYRLDEPTVFPAEIEDVQAAVRWVRAHAGDYGVDPERIAAVGESAGGHLAAMLATLGRGSLGDDARVRVAASWSPPVDLTVLAGERGGEWASRVIGCGVATCPDVLARSSPVNHVDGSDAPLYLVNSTAELVPLSQAQAMAARLQAAGVAYELDVLPGTRHALDFRDDAWGPTVAFLEQHLPAEDETDTFALVVGLAAVVVLLGAVLVTIAGQRA